MSSSIVSPFPFFTDTTGAPLEGGYIYLGQSNLNPETAPVNVFWDAALTIPAPNPVRTVGGYPSRAGTASRLYVSTDTYSITVRNRNRALVFSAFDQSDAPSSVFDISTQLITAGINQLTFGLTVFTYLPGTDTLQVFRNGLRLNLGLDYLETNSSTITLTAPAALGDQFLFQGGAVITGDQTPGSAVSFIQSGTGAVTRNIQDKARESVSVKDFGAVGDGVTDDTAKINAAITASQGKCIYFPAGTYCYSGNGPFLDTGTTIKGDGRNASIIKVTVAAPPHVFHAAGRGSGIRSLGFIAGVTQTSGCWAKITGIESFIEDFAMTGDFNGIYLSASVGTVRNGRMQFAAAGATRIIATGGDNSQVIDGVLMGAQDGPNIAAYGILVQNNVALTITNTSVIQMGVGLGIIATQTSENVLNLSAANCYFDNCTAPVKILASGTGSVNRVTFLNVWAASSQGAGENGVTIINTSANEIGGFSFTNCQFCLNLGAGISISGAAASVISDVSIIGGFFSQNVYGIYLGKYIYGIKIIGASIGKGGLFNANSNTGLFVDTNVDNLLCADNIITFNTVKQVNYNSTNPDNVIRNNIGFRTQYTGNAAISSGSSSVSFNHFCDTTPSIDAILLTPRQSLSAVGITSFWVSAVTATQITVTASNAVSANFLFNFTVRANNS